WEWPERLPEAPGAVATATAEEFEGQGGGGFSGGSEYDGLAAYLGEMGSIPLLKGEKETALGWRLGGAEGRDTRAARGACGGVAGFAGIAAGRVSLERTVDVVPGLGLTWESIRGRLPGHLAELRRLVARRDSPGRAGRARLRRAVAVAEELSPRTELLDEWTE